MKIKNLLLLLVLFNGFIVDQLLGAQGRVGPVGVDFGRREGEGAEEHKGPDLEDGAALAEDCTGADREEGLSADGIVSGAERQAGGAFAKIALLRGSLTSASKAMQGASLLHGAMLWEFGIVKMLYVLLVTPKEVEVAGEARLEPDSEKTLFPLGKALIQFFRLTGEAFKPSSAQTVVSVHLSPKDLGKLYKVLINKEETPEPFQGPRPEKVRAHGVKDYKDALNSCKINTTLNPKNLLPSIISAFFWAKFVMGITLPKVPTIQEAHENIRIFMEAAQDSFSACGAGIVGEESIDVEGHEDTLHEAQNIEAIEAEVVARIKALYQYNIPKPPIQGNAIIQPLPGQDILRKFADCGESGIRGLLCAAFYNIALQEFLIPAAIDGQPDAYSAKLRAYFQTYKSVANQNAQEARNAWAVLCSDRPGIIYDLGSASGCDLECSFENVMSLLVCLVPGAKPSDCICGQSSEEARAGVGVDGLVSLTKPIHDHDCAKKILTNFCMLPGHDLKVGQINVGQTTSWEISSKKAGDKNCHLYFDTQPGHMDCEMHTGAQVTFGSLGQIEEPILGAIDALSIIPKDPDAIAPLIFAASRMAQQRNFVDGFVRNYRLLNDEQKVLVVSNVQGWKFMLPEQDNNLEDISDKTIFFAAAKRGYCSLIESLFREPDFCVDDKNSNDSTPLMKAAEYGHLKVVKSLKTKGAVINHQNNNGNTALMMASQNGHFDVVNFLINKALDAKCDANLQTTLGNTALIMASQNGHFDVVDLLLKKGAVINHQNNKGNTALMLAAQYGHVNVVNLLLENGARANISDENSNTALMIAALYGDLEVVRFLLDNVPDIQFAERALSIAAANNHPELVKFLIDKNVIYDPHRLKQSFYFHCFPKELKEQIDSAIPNTAWQRALSRVRKAYQALTDAFKAYSEAVHPYVP